MKNLFFLLALIAICSFGLFFIGVVFYACIEVFFYFFQNIPISFEIFQFRRMLKMSIWGGFFLGFGITFLRLLKIKGF
ncbi:hypothetical protein [Enterobacillus tribolii]|uniref:Uncharacterized protein n=1 Tax=Enterobacillus tribolii TaxID=1487935 RepID=A0A370QGJ6_9GAMM|nr:hypothetical protein [Enterobacillus tribolii]MBW7981806.1 hypothetical protein [Enterobacillus tribolii]RDK87487.1 hypothetical protein C8D90_10982 [Enterobacillus tribolii]